MEWWIYHLNLFTSMVRRCCIPSDLCPRGVENRNWYANLTGKQPKIANETLLSPRKKESHHHAAEPSRADHRGRVLASNVAETTAALRIQFSKIWRRGEGGRELESHSHPQLRTQLFGALNFLCMNYDVRNSWLVSHQNEAPILARGLERFRCHFPAIP